MAIAICYMVMAAWRWRPVIGYTVMAIEMADCYRDGRLGSRSTADHFSCEKLSAADGFLSRHFASPA
jgi:hypothetical protein